MKGPGKEAWATRWEEKAAGILDRANRVCWNGKFYTHWVPRDGFRIEGVDIEKQLFLSNPMAINPGLAEGGMARSILEEYREREKRSRTFASWFHGSTFPGRALRG